LLLPRPEECIKWLFLPISFVLGVWSLGGIDEAEVWRAAVVFFALEYLIYEARYQWNDIRGYASDSDHPESALRGRLPLGRTLRECQRNVVASLAVAGIRILTAVALGVALGERFLVPILALLALVIVIAAVYEWLRARVDGTNPPNDEGRRLVVGVWIWVGSGYALRGGTGLWLAGFSLADPVVLLTIPMFVAFGVMFVTLTWVVEALSHCTRVGSTDAPLREVTYSVGLAAKRHLRELLQYLDLNAKEGELDNEPDCRDVYALATRGVTRAPWNFALGISAPLCGAAGVALATGGGLTAAQWPFAAAAAVFSAAGALALVNAQKTSWRLFVVALVALALGSLGMMPEIGGPALSMVPWLVVSGTYVGFRAQSYESLHAGMKPLLDGLGSAYLLLLQRCVGPSTARLIGLSKRTSD
jgi:hypothetical protein